MCKASVFVFILFVVGLVGGLHAQEFKGGLVGGLTSSQVDGDRYSGFHKLGFHLGGYVSRSLSEKSSLQFGVQYNQKGSYRNFKNDPSREFYRIRLHYVELPFRWQYQYWGRIAPYIGVSFSYLIKSKEEDSFGELHKDVSPAFNKTDMNAMLGFKYTVKPQIAITVDLAYSLYSIRTLSTESVFLRQGKQYNRLIKLGLEYALK